MQILNKRIQKLEKAAVPVLRAHRRIAEQALAEVSDLESLISALGADREGRSLTESESASRQAYSSAFEREFAAGTAAPAIGVRACAGPKCHPARYYPCDVAFFFT